MKKRAATPGLVLLVPLETQPGSPFYIALTAIVAFALLFSMVALIFFLAVALARRL